MDVKIAEAKAPAPALRYLHPLIIGIVTALWAQIAVWGLLVGAFSDVAVLIVVVVAIPVLYVVVIAAITRATTGRASIAWNILLAATLVAFGVTVSVSEAAVSLLGGVPMLPLTLGIAAGVTSLIVLPRLARVVGILAVVAQVAVVSIPFANAQVQQSEQRTADDAAEIARRNELFTRPYAVAGYSVQIVLPTDYRTEVRIARDPDEPVRDDYQVGDDDITISTSPLIAGQSIPSEVCGWILNPDAGGSPSNSCEQIDDDTWLLEAFGERSVVRIRDGSRIEVSGGRLDVAAFVTLVDDAELMTVDEFADWNLWLFERDQRV
ncbi:hypothetical protein N1027_14425 [Herbiconiux sp. CPCC 205763]|uniref:ABC transporter permease n=1 Tax=Herbiconiux aconitum TaxID=2970913 RepID=A0ABT2GSZ7_9MICO|nr:hypothetical protein [Herbiconiux aconitum]MCS5719330.1 hypothetical protein [Herbiconiux aconitum]